MAELAFIDKVAERAGVPEDTARLLTEGTLLTLAAVGHKEFTDAMAQLPREFGQLEAQAPGVGDLLSPW